VSGGITEPPCHWEAEIQEPCPPGWGLDTRLMTSLCKKHTAVKSKEVKTRWYNLQRRLWLKKGCFNAADVVVVVVVENLKGPGQPII
jgi:hypothetical protein